jgi:hypothetical protein
MLGNLVMLNMNPLGDNGVMLSGIGQVIVVAITLFIQIKKRDPKIPLKVPLLRRLFKTD